MKINRITTALLLLLLSGLAVRLAGIRFGLPEPYHLEEPFYTRAAFNLGCEGDADTAILQPHTYIQAALISAANLVRGGDFCASQFDQILSTLILQSRLISAVAGAVTILIVFWLGKLLYNEEIGIIGAAFLTFNFLHVRDSHFGTPDLVSTLLITISLLMYARVVKGGSRTSDYLLAGVFTALSVNARPTAVLLLVPFFYSHLVSTLGTDRINLRWFRSAILDKRLILGLFVCGILALLLHPQLWIDPIEFGKYWINFLSLGEMGGFGRLQVDPLSAPLFYFRAVVWAFGYLLTALIVVGLGISLFKHRKSDVLLLCFVIPYILLASSSTVYFARYIIPALPFLSLFAAFGLTALWRGRGSVYARAGIVLFLLLQPALQIGRLDYLLRQEDTRSLAVAWIDAHIPKGAKVASEWHGPPIKGFQLVTVDFYGLSELPLDFYRENSFDYLIVSSFIRDAVMINPLEEAQKTRFYQELENSGTLVKVISPVIGDHTPPYVIDRVLGPIDHLFLFERPGPEIRIYRVP